MANFPTSLDSITNPTPTTPRNATGGLALSVQVGQLNDIVEAIEAKVGVDASAVTTSHDYKLSGVTGTAKAVATDDSRLTDSRTPTGSAGGVLSGTYPNPTFAADMATQAELDAHAAASDPHTGYQQESEKGSANGYASLDSGGKVPSNQLPALALTDVFSVASQAAQLALTAEEGDVAIRSDLNKSYIHNGGVSGTMSDWSELLTPTDAVLSVAGRTGAVTLSSADIGDATAAGIAVLTAATAAAQRTALGLGAMAIQDPASVLITGGAASGLADVQSAALRLTTSGVVTNSNASITLQLASHDGRVLVTTSASAVTLTLPASMTVGVRCLIVCNGAGLVTFSAGSGATILGATGITEQGAAAELVVIANSGGSAAVYQISALPGVLTAAGRALLAAASAAAQRTALGLGTSAVIDVPASGNASTSQVAKGSDTRLIGGMLYLYANFT